MNIKPIHKSFEIRVYTLPFCEILARNYAPGAVAPGAAAPGASAPGAWIIWGNILSSICSRSIVHFKYAPGAYLLYAPGAYLT